MGGGAGVSTPDLDLTPDPNLDEIIRFEKFLHKQGSFFQTIF